MNNDWIQTFTGRKFWPLEPRAEDVCIEDIAHALAMKCRFTGHCREFLSVAQHSVLVSEVVAALDGDVDAQMAGLLHDAGEAYLPDVAKPIKDRVLCQGGNGTWHFGDMEELLLQRIFEGLGVSDDAGYGGWRLVKTADIIMLCTEARDLMGADWTANFNPPFLWNKVVPQSPGTAKARFLERFSVLNEKRRVSAVV